MMEKRFLKGTGFCCQYANSDPSNLAVEADSGDHLHPADAGYKRMADSIALKLFEK